MNIEKKKLILKTAENLFNRFGVKKTAVDDIAAQARVAKGTIYNNFGSKNGLLREIMREKIAAFDKVVNAALQGIKDPVEELKVMLAERLKIVMSSPFLCDRMLRGDDITLREMSDELDRRLRAFINSILDHELPALIVSEKTRIMNSLVYFLRGLEQSLCDTLAYDPEKIENDLEYLIKRMIPASEIK